MGCTDSICFFRDRYFDLYLILSDSSPSNALLTPPASLNICRFLFTNLFSSNNELRSSWLSRFGWVLIPLMTTKVVKVSRMFPVSMSKDLSGIFKFLKPFHCVGYALNFLYTKQAEDGE